MSATFRKLLYGFLAFGPLALLLLSCVLFWGAMLGTMTLATDRPDVGTGMVFGFIGFNMLAMLLGFLGLLMGILLYSLHILRNRRVPDDHRLLWIIGVFVTGSLAQILYFVLYILKDKPGDNYPNLKPKQPWE
jgi:hypothetical protein